MEYLHSVPKTHFRGNPCLVQLLPQRPGDLMQARLLFLDVPRTVSHQVHRRDRGHLRGKPQHLGRDDHQTEGIDAYNPAIATTPILPQTKALPRLPYGDLDRPTPLILLKNLR